jgi:drug/metabolite transporter (DMT)-like permease
MADAANKEDLRGDNPILGMTCAVAAFFTFSVMNVFAKLLSEHHHVIEVAFFRNVVAVIPLLIWIYGMGRRDILVIRSSPRAIVVRSVIGTVSLAATFGAYSLMPMADASAFLFTSSLLIPAFCFFFLKEHVGPYRWTAIMVGFLGVCVMLQPSGNVNLTGVGVALGAAVMHASLQTILRALGKTESPETVTFYFVFIGSFVSLIPMPLVFTMPTWSEVPYIIGLGITGVIAQLLLSVAYKHAKASIVTVFNYSGIIWATTFGWMFFKDWPDNAIFIGGAIVISSNVFIVYREQKLARQAKAVIQKADGL